MSGPPGTALNMSSGATALHTLAVAEKTGCSQSGEEQLRCLRAVPIEDLLDAALAYSIANHPPAGLFTFVPSVDGDFFPDRQSVLYKSGRFVKGKHF
jgi:carboxylesterase type B